MNLWAVEGTTLTDIPQADLEAENRLEDWLAHDPSRLGIDVLVFGRQVQTEHSGRIDLLGLDADGFTYVLELKRGRTPREVVAQVLDYASWVKGLDYQDLDSICMGYLGRPLAEAFSDRFGVSLPETVNAEHRLVVIASELDDASERIIQYLADDRGLPINAVFFQYFVDRGRELVGRAWLRDPEATEETGGSRKRPPWSGYWFFNVGEGKHRNWDDCREFGFLAAGQGEKYSTPLKKLKPADPVFAYMKGKGYVGFGVVTGEAKPIREAALGSDGRTLESVRLRAPQALDNANDPRLSEWIVPIEWKRTVPRDDARFFAGAFANQNIVCKLRHPETIQFLEREFGVRSPFLSRAEQPPHT
jgi:hypothetical protein